jgi:alpha 1,2-mannosyltransferase
MNSTKEIPINGLGCPSNRANPHRVAVPSAPNKDHLTKLWSELNALFETHAPSPAHLDTPKHAHGDPPKEKIGSFFNITNEEAQTSREQHEQLVAKLPEYPRGQFKGRGVVMLAGGKYSEYGATSLGMLREVGSKLPIEIWVKDQTEEIPGWCAELAKEGIACRRLADYMDMGVLKHPYQWKVFTILYSSFSEILFLDADSMPVRSPDYLFEAHKYKESGAILWPDYWNHSGSPWAPFITGISGEPHDIMQEKKSVESGQLVWNKERHWKVRSR